MNVGIHRVIGVKMDIMTHHEDTISPSFEITEDVRERTITHRIDLYPTTYEAGLEIADGLMMIATEYRVALLAMKDKK